MADRLISCDDHMDLSQLPADLWTTRLPASLLDRAPHVEERTGWRTRRRRSGRPSRADRRRRESGQPRMSETVSARSGKASGAKETPGPARSMWR